MKFNVVAFWVIAAILALFITAPSHAATKNYVGQCVVVKTAIVKKQPVTLGHPILVANATDADSIGKPLNSYRPFSVKAQIGERIQLVTSPNYELPDTDPNSEGGQVIGWVKLTEMEFQDLRNCN